MRRRELAGRHIGAMMNHLWQDIALGIIAGGVFLGGLALLFAGCVISLLGRRLRGDGP